MEEKNYNIDDQKTPEFTDNKINQNSAINTKSTRRNAAEHGNEYLNNTPVKNINIIEEISNFKVSDFINRLKKEIRDIKEDLNISTLKDDISDLSLKNKITISFLWLILLVNIIIYTNGDLHILFFSDVNIVTLIFLIILCLCFVLLETFNIIKAKNDKLFYDYILFFIYFGVVSLILFLSLLDAKGWGWEFYLVIIFINLDLIILPKFNIYYKN